MKNKTLRNSNIEILRILLILMVIGVHYNLTGMGNAFLYTQNTGINVSLTNILESICIVCVDTFIIICGYFQISKEKIDKSKIIKFIITILFFNLVQYILSIFINNTAFSFRTMISQMLSGKWFIIIYLVLYSLSPFINKLIKTLDIKEYKKLLIILVSIFIVYQTFLSYVNLFMPVMGWSGIIDQGIDKGYTIINFIVLYLIGGYIKKSNINPRLKISTGTYLISTVIIFMSWYILSHLHFNNVGIQYYYNNIFVVLSSISLFLIFNRIKIKNSKIINYISKQTMTIFILSTSPFLLQLYNIMDVEKYSITKYLIPHFVITCLVIYIASLGIGIIGNLILDKTIFKLIDTKIKMKNI